MSTPKILENFLNLEQLPKGKLEELVVELQDVMEFGNRIQEFKNQIVTERKYENASKVRLVERIVMRTIADHVLQNYGIELLVKPYNRGGDLGRILFEDIPTVSLEELRVRIVDNRMLEL